MKPTTCRNCQNAHRARQASRAGRQRTAERQDLKADYADYADCSGGITGALAPGPVLFLGNSISRLSAAGRRVFARLGEIRGIRVICVRVLPLLPLSLEPLPSWAHKTLLDASEWRSIPPPSHRRRGSPKVEREIIRRGAPSTNWTRPQHQYDFVRLSPEPSRTPRARGVAERGRGRGSNDKVRADPARPPSPAPRVR